MNLILTCGAPGAGKSTYISGLGFPIVSRDKIRFNLLKDGEPYFSREDEVYDIFIEEIKKNISSNTDCIVDATHLNSRSRSILLGHLPLENVNVNFLCFETPLEECLKRNADRHGRALVPEQTVRNMWNSYRRPSKDELFGEYYNEIKVIK